MNLFSPRLVRLIKWLVLVVILLSLISIILSKITERKIIYNFFSDAHAQSNLVQPFIKIKLADKSFDRYFEVASLERQLSRSFILGLTAQRLNQPNLLDQFFSDQAYLAFSELVEEQFFTFVYGGELNVNFVQQNGSLIVGHGRFDVASLSRNGVVEDRQIQNLGVHVVLKKSALNWKLSSFEVTDWVEQKPQPRKLFVKNLYGVNYYPKSHQWRQFWQNFDPVEIEQDFALIKALPSNSVRVFLNYGDFSDLNSEHYSNLQKLLDIAEQYSLTTVITLFDLKPAYNLETLSADLLTLTQILETVQRGRYDVVLDLKNEIDLDFEHHREDSVRVWLEAMIEAVLVQSNLPVTVGWSSAEHALEYVESLDIVSYHDYASLSDTSQNLERVKFGAGGKSIYISEIGVTSAEIGFGLPSSEEKQFQELKQRLDKNSSADSFAIWTLYDFESVDTSAIGNSPWRRLLQRHYGLISSEGNYKPAANAVRDFFGKRLY